MQLSVALSPLAIEHVMRSFTAVAVAMLSLAGLAAAIRNPNNPADPINCPPSGGADKCSKETKVSPKLYPTAY